MTTAARDPQVVPRPQRRRCAPPTRAWPTPWSLESVLSDDTRRVYGAQWRLFTGWCDEVGVSRVKYICRALPQIGRYRKERFT